LGKIAEQVLEEKRIVSNQSGKVAIGRGIEFPFPGTEMANGTVSPRRDIEIAKTGAGYSKRGLNSPMSAIR
jgi:hypothetical protein